MKRILSILCFLYSIQSVAASHVDILLGGQPYQDSIRIMVRFFELPEVGSISLKLSFNQEHCRFGRIASVSAKIPDAMIVQSGSQIVIAWDGIPAVSMNDELIAEFVFWTNGMTTLFQFDRIQCEITDAQANPLVVAFNDLQFNPIQNIDDYSSYRSLVVSDNFPNPFNGTTTFSIFSNQGDALDVKLLSINGEQIFVFPKMELHNGRNLMRISLAGLQLTSGIYLIRLSSTKQSFTRKISYMK